MGNGTNGSESGAGEFGEPQLATAVWELRDLEAKSKSEKLPLEERFKAQQQAIGAEKILRTVRKSFRRN